MLREPLFEPFPIIQLPIAPVGIGLKHPFSGPFPVEKGYEITKELTIKDVEEMYYASLKEDISKAESLLPKKFSVDDIVERIKIINSKKEYEQRYKQWLENQHKLFIKLREIGRAKAMDNAFDFIRFTKEFIALHEKKMEIEIKNYREINYPYLVSQFLESNLPNNFLSNTCGSILWEWVATNCHILEGQKIKKEFPKVVRARVKLKKLIQFFDNYIDNLKTLLSWVSYIQESRENLLLYVDLHNSKTIDDVFVLKEIKIENVNKEIYTKAIQTLENNIENLKSQLWGKYPDVCQKVNFVGEDERKFMSDIMAVNILETKGIY